MVISNTPRHHRDTTSQVQKQTRQARIRLKQAVVQLQEWHAVSGNIGTIAYDATTLDVKTMVQHNWQIPWSHSVLLAGSVKEHEPIFSRGFSVVKRSCLPLPGNAMTWSHSMNTALALCKLLGISGKQMGFGSLLQHSLITFDHNTVMMISNNCMLSMWKVKNICWLRCWTRTGFYCLRHLLCQKLYSMRLRKAMT